MTKTKRVHGEETELENIGEWTTLPESLCALSNPKCEYCGRIFLDKIRQTDADGSWFGLSYVLGHRASIRPSATWAGLNPLRKVLGALHSLLTITL